MQEKEINNPMKENAILVRPDNIEKIYIDFSNDENICTAIEAKGLSAIHTIKTQDISKELGIHLIGYVDRHGGSLDNRLAAKISGYDEIYSLMLLCKIDDKWNNLPLSEGELNSLYAYLTTGKVISNNDNDLSRTFFEKYGIYNPILPKSNARPDVYQLPEVPYVLLFRYEIKKMSDKDAEAFGKALFTMADRLLKEGFEKVDGVWLSPDKKYYINSKLNNENKAFNVLVQAKEEVDEVLIVDVIGSANGIMGKLPEQNREDMDTAMEEAIDYDEQDTILPELNIPDPLDDVKDKKIDRGGRVNIPDPLDDVKNKKRNK